MKKLWITVAILSLGIVAEANHNLKASISFKSNGDYPIIVRMDGNRHQQPPKKVVHFNNIRSGSHYVQIYKLQRHGHWHSSRRDLIYSGYIQARPGFKTVYGLRHGQLRLLNRKPIQGGHGNGHGYGHGYGHGQGQGYGACGVHGTYNCGCDGYPGSNRPQWDSPFNGFGCYDGQCSDNCGGSCSYSNGYYSDGYGYGSNLNPLSNKNFESILRRSQRYFSDEQKVKFFLRELDGKYVKTSQARCMVDVLFFEQHKYHLLTSLYDQVVDSGRYNDLSSVFFFNNTRKDFEEYVNANYRKKGK